MAQLYLLTTFYNPDPVDHYQVPDLGKLVKCPQNEKMSPENVLKSMYNFVTFLCEKNGNFALKTSI